MNLFIKVSRMVLPRVNHKSAVTARFMDAKIVLLLWNVVGGKTYCYAPE